MVWEGRHRLDETGRSGQLWLGCNCCALALGVEVVQ